MDFFTLSQLNSLAGEELKRAFPDTYWLLAETSDVRFNSNGHCYLEFIEKEEKTGTLIAKARAYIWRNTLQVLKPYFEEKTGQSFRSGIKVLVKVSIDFHPLYGYGLSIYDIDPAYTVGDMQRRREEILKQLEEDGTLTLNQELEIAPAPQRIAVITSSTAAGYEDFLNHLLHNKSGFVFYPHLFPAVMQGEQTETSVIAALEKIYLHRDQFDAVVIIRGGGASSDLQAFDSYLLASHCAQFPLPVITGIGHERDNTVLDFIAFHRAKTPTAVADYFVNLLTGTYENLLEMQDALIADAVNTIDRNKDAIQRIMIHFPFYLNKLLERHNYRIKTVATDIPRFVKQFLQNKKTEIQEKETFFHLSSPEYILAKGYSITLKDGKALKTTEN
ncbi:MAG: exodeoxyribonuclease VII large subunit, partial [Candidatus Symbiothrix sp.]|nr:exodeoxyribonuclease VII large subunit [Candidatus Symbiothrix sp.]